MKVLYLGSSEKKYSGKDLNKIETRYRKEVENEQFENQATKMLKC